MSNGHGTRAAMKRLLERVAVRSGARASTWRMRRRAIVLAYHNVVPDGSAPCGDRSLHLPVSDFAAQLDALRATHEVVPLSELLDAAWARGHSRPRAAITFDDAYAGALSLGADELRARGLPATIFVSPAFVDGGSFWWDALADATHGLSASHRALALTRLRGIDAEIRVWASDSGIGRAHDVPWFARVAGTDLMNERAQSGFAFGSHAWSHANLTALSDEDLAAELYRPLAWLDLHLPAARRWLSYPYGLFDDRVAAAAVAAGYEAAVAIDGGWTRVPPSDRFAIPRVNVPAGLSLDGFRLRVAGMVGV